jgi:hypothetical protein
MLFAENVKFTCTGDTATGVTQYRETYSFAGEPNLTTTNYLWPDGSGCTGSISMFDAGGENSLISNGGFDTWSNASAAPENWTIVTGSAGSTITRSSDNKRGTYAIALNADGSTLHKIKQQLSTSLVKPNQVMLYNFWAKVDTDDDSGVLRIRLVDGNGTAISNDQSTAQSQTYNIGSDIATSYTRLSGSFQTPRQLPSTGVFLEISFSTSPNNTRVITIDLIGLKIGQTLYSGGPYVAAFSGATNNAVGDYSTLALSNDATANFFVKALDRFFDLRTKNLYFPSAASETVVDTLLTS